MTWRWYLVLMFKYLFLSNWNSLWIFYSTTHDVPAATIELNPLLPLYFGTQRTFGGRPLMLKCRPSKPAHCSSLKSFFCLEHGSELHERNFILRPTQYFPPFLGLKIMKTHKQSVSSHWENGTTVKNKTFFNRKSLLLSWWRLCLIAI